MREIHKDLIWVLYHDSFIPNEVLGTKGEERFPNVEGTGRDNVRPHPDLERIFTGYEIEHGAPINTIIMNSALCGVVR